MKAEPQKEPRWLEKLVGEWNYEVEAIMGPDQPPSKHTGTESVRSLTVWVQCEGRGEMPGGGTATTVMTLGYDPAKKRFVGTFIGSMMTHMWVYDGELNGKLLPLSAAGRSSTDPAKTATYRDTIEFKNDDHRVLTSAVLGEDGKWTQFMTANYRRKK